MKFYYQIQVNRYTTRFKSEQTEIDSGYFESPSIQAAKSKLSRMANTMELFSWVQSWDNENRVYTGKELRWRKWSDHAFSAFATDKNGKPARFTQRVSERESGETIYDDESSKYGRSVNYTVTLSLYWAKKGDEDV